MEKDEKKRIHVFYGSSVSDNNGSFRADRMSVKRRGKRYCGTGQPDSYDRAEA